MFKNCYNFYLIILFSFFFTACSLGANQSGFFQQIHSRSLSLNDPELRTCVFDPYYSVIHFPMYHEPPVNNYSNEIYDLVVKSQFQLLHTIIDYNRAVRPLAVFDERVTSDSYNSKYIQKIEQGLAQSDTYKKFNGKVFYFSERKRTAEHLFGQGFPSHYEYLNEPQKNFLFDTGASLALYFLQELSKVYKVISTEKLKIVQANLSGNWVTADRNENHYWIFTFRDMELRREVNGFYQKNPFYKGLVFIAYGAEHDLSKDFAGLPFQSGRDFCLKWDRSSSPLP